VPNDVKSLVQQMRGPNQATIRMFAAMRSINFKLEYDTVVEAIEFCEI